MKAIKFFARQTLRERAVSARERNEARRLGKPPTPPRQSWTGNIGSDVDHAFIELGLEDSISVMVGNRVISVKVAFDGRVHVRDQEITRPIFDTPHVNQTLEERAAEWRITKMNAEGFVPDPYTGAPVRMQEETGLTFQMLEKEAATLNPRAYFGKHGINMTARDINAIFDPCDCPVCQRDRAAIYRKD